MLYKIFLIIALFYSKISFCFIATPGRNMNSSMILYGKHKKEKRRPPWAHLFEEEIEPEPLGKPWEKLAKEVASGERRVRLTVKKSHLQMYAAVVDDLRNQVICTASSNLPVLTPILGTKPTRDPAIRRNKGNDVRAAYEVGKHIGRLALAKGVSKVYFDRSGYKYHGRVEAIAVGARKVGLQL